MTEMAAALFTQGVLLMVWLGFAVINFVAGIVFIAKPETRTAGIIIAANIAPSTILALIAYDMIGKVMGV